MPRLWRRSRSSRAHPPRCSNPMAPDRSGSEQLPLSLGHGPGDVFARDRAGAVTLAQWLGDVHQIAARLPPVGHALNLCESSYAFSTAFAAALVRGQTNLLPASRTPDV